MTVTEWAGALLFPVLLAWQVAGLLGPFRLVSAERPLHAGRGRLVRVWFAGWLRRPRERLTAEDWGRGGRMFFPSLAVAGLWCATIGALIADARPHLGVAVATGLGCWGLFLVIVGYVKRPARTPATVPAQPPFPHRLRGYDSTEVDRVFAGLEPMTSVDILSTRFRVVTWGYDKKLVDQALAAAAAGSR